MNQAAAINKINRLASLRSPFLFLIDFEMKQIRVWESGEVPDKVLYQIGPYSNYSSYSLTNEQPVLDGVIPFSKQKYLNAFHRVQDEIHYGNSFLLNLTGKSEIFMSYSLEDIFFLSQAPYKLCCKDEFVFFSPESFLKIDGLRISSFPMKGTIDAEIKDAEALILSDPKEKAEHNTIVDLIRNDMSRYAKNVMVSRFRYVEKIKSAEKKLLQVSSEVHGMLGENYRRQLGEIIFSQLPAGSISGAPKARTLEIIRDVEEDERGFYTGVAGFYDGDSLDSCVMIRFIEKTAGRYFYRSGGGITFMSEAEKEYKELLQKVYVPTY